MQDIEERKITRRILLDMRSPNGTWGDKSLSLGALRYYESLGDNITIISNFSCTSTGSLPETKDLSSADKLKNQKFDYLYNPDKEPVDFFSNIIVPTFKCNYWDIGTNFRTKNFPESEDYDTILDSTNCREFVWSKKSKQFDYRLEDSKKDSAYNYHAEILKKTTNIVLYANWDDEGIYCKPADRRRGLGMTRGLWERMTTSVRSIDNFCLKNPDHKIILFNKKAVGWSSFLKSEYIDFRNFENLGLSFSQAFELCVNNSIGSIGYWSSPQIWFNFAKGKKHIVYFVDKPWRVVRNISYYGINSLISERDVSNLFPTKVVFEKHRIPLQYKENQEISRIFSIAGEKSRHP